MSKRNIGEIMRIDIAVPIWGATLFLAVVLCALYAVPIPYRPFVNHVVAVLGGIAGLTSAWYVAIAMHRRHAHTRKEATFQLLGRLLCAEYLDVIDFIREEVVDAKNDLSPAQLAEKIHSIPARLRSVVHTLEALEMVSLAVQHDYVDEDIVHQHIGYITQFLFDTLDPYLTIVRAKTENQAIYCEGGKLYQAWRNGRSLSGGAAFADSGG